MRNIYQSVGTPKNLQDHMVRVGNLTKHIVGSWKGPIVKSQDVIDAAFLHDIAKPISFDMERQSAFVSSADELRSVQSHRDSLIDKYGPEEHAALIKMVAELGFDTNVQRILEQFDWDNVPHLIVKQDFEVLIPLYADMRTSPKGIVNLNDRLYDLQQRAPVANFEDRLRNAQELEKLIKQSSILT